MATAFDNLLDGLATYLAAAPAVASVILTDETDPIPEETTQALELALDRSGAQQLGGMHGNPLDWVTRVRITCHARASGAGTSGTTARQAVNALMAAVHAKLMADPSLGLGADVFVNPPSDVNWDIARKADHMAAVQITYPIDHRTSGTTL